MAHEPKPGSSVLDAQAYAQHETAVAVIMNVFYVRHMVRTYAAFGGDLLEAVVLGEIGHHNVAAASTGASGPHALSDALSTMGTPGGAPLLPTNAFSIAQATGIPRETVRRKVAALVRRGWVTRDADGNLYATDRPIRHFAAFNLEACQALLKAADEIRALVGRAGERRGTVGPRGRPPTSRA